MLKVFIIWTTFICNNGEVANVEQREAGKHRFFSRNLYSSDMYTSKDAVNKAKARWSNYYIAKRIDDPISCIAFMIQHEDITDKLILKQVLGL